jgi:hypothetical protein
MQRLDLGRRERTAWVCSHWLHRFAKPVGGTATVGMVTHSSPWILISSSVGSGLVMVRRCPGEGPAHPLWPSLSMNRDSRHPLKGTGAAQSYVQQALNRHRLESPQRDRRPGLQPCCVPSRRTRGADRLLRRLTPGPLLAQSLGLANPAVSASATQSRRRPGCVMDL